MSRMTLAQHERALESVNLLSTPFRGVNDIILKLARAMVVAAIKPEQSKLIISPQVVTGLATLQSAVQDLSRAYIAHTNTVIGKGPGSSLELMNLTNPLGVDETLFRVAATPAPGAVTDGEGGKKKRKRAPHDTNAPKRALTPYFLYMQTARPLIATQMKPGYKAKEVADEGTKRWAAMPKAEKDVSLSGLFPHLDRGSELI